jgi:proline dehydrogenase
LNERLKATALALWRPIERRAAGAYLAGPDLSDALEAGERITARGYGLVLGFWNTDGQDPRDVAAENLAAIEALHGRGWDGYLSIKGPALGFSANLFHPIVEASAERGAVVQLDSHGTDTADATIALAGDARKMHAAVGVTIPGRWRRSVADAERAVELGLRARVVKGEWADPADPYRNARDGFLAVVDRLAGATHVSVATHDAALAGEAVERLASAGVPHDVEMLLGLPFAPVVEVVRAAGLPARVYVPYGHASLRYGLGYLRRNPRRIGWLARDLLLRNRGTLPPALDPAVKPCR